MEERPSRTELIKILIQDRNHHFSHPHEVAIKFLYSIGGTITTLLVAFFIKGNVGKTWEISSLIMDHPVAFGVCGLLFVLGYALIFWGLGEHKAIHTNQRKRLESAIEYLVAVKPKEFNFDEFWKEYGNINLYYSRHKQAKLPTSLLVAEPDSRSWINYHDRKIELGILSILISLFWVLITLFL